MKMLFTLAFGVALIAASALSIEQKCSIADPSNTVNISIRSKRNETGKWVTKFSARGGAEGMSDGMALDISQSLVECDGVKILEIQGVLGVDKEQSGGPAVLNPDTPAVEKPEKLYFHENTGVNIELSNDGRTATRKNAEANIGGGSLITNRALKDDELFEVRLDNALTKWSGSLSIGVTDNDPATVTLLDHWTYFRSGVWIYYLHSLFNNGNEIRNEFGVDLQKLKVGDRLGVMRTSDCLLHFFANGVDQGAAPPKLTGTIYGVLDLYGNPTQATILKP